MSCLFCKIVSGEIPSHKIWEDKNHIAILDIFPNTLGQTLVIPKKHYDSYIFDMTDKSFTDVMLAAKSVGKLLDSKLGVQRTAVIIEGVEVNHVHVKLYPLHGLGKKDVLPWSVEEKFFEKYPGFTTSVLGPKADDKKLSLLAKKICGK